MKMMNFRMEELLPIVTWLSEKYTSKESTSISYEGSLWKLYCTVFINVRIIIN